MPQNLLFTLPSLLPESSKLPRVLSICRSIDRNKFIPFVSVDHPARLHPEGIHLLDELDVKVLVLRMSPHPRDMAQSLKEIFSTPFFLRKLEISIQHSSDYSRWWFEPLIAKLGGVKYWITTKANTDCQGFYWALRLRLADRVIAQAPVMAQLIKHNIPSVSNKIVIIPNGVNTDVFFPQEIDFKLRKELGLHPESLVLGYVAHLVSVKDHPSLLRALAKVRNKNIELLLIGRVVDRVCEQHIQTLVEQLGLSKRVHFLGLRQDIAALHSIMHGIVLASWGESSSNAILEGMSSGLPVISSDVGGMPSAVQDGVNGWLVPRGENFVTKLAEAIEDWAGSPDKRKIFGQASRQIVLEKFSLDRMVQGHISLYEELINS